MGTGFDTYAEEYDAGFTNTSTGIAQRKRVWHFLDKYLLADTSVLEINCGTGADAQYMSAKVKSVQACDLSEPMLNLARMKPGLRVAHNVGFFQSDIRKIRQATEQKFDLIFSNFSGLNCLGPQEIQQFAADAKHLLSNRGHLVIVVFGTRCIWENLYFFLKKDPRRGRRNKKGAVLSTIGNEDLSTYYYNRKELLSVFGDYTFCEARPIGLFLPPGFMEKHFAGKKILLSILNFLESLSAMIPGTADFGDHMLLVFRKDESTLLNDQLLAHHCL